MRKTKMLYVVEVRDPRRNQEFDWFWGFDTITKARACIKEHFGNKHPCETRITKWKAAS